VETSFSWGVKDRLILLINTSCVILLALLKRLWILKQCAWIQVLLYVTYLTGKLTCIILSKCWWILVVEDWSFVAWLSKYWLAGNIFGLRIILTWLVKHWFARNMLI
jgi:hypothetical protein